MICFNATMRESRVSNEPERKKTYYRVDLDRGLDEALGDEAEARRRAGWRFPHRSKRAVLRDALRFYLASKLSQRFGGGEAPPLGTELRRIRMQRGQNMSELSRDSGVSVASILRIEQEADRSPRLETLEALARALDVSIVVDPTGVAVLRRS